MLKITDYFLLPLTRTSVLKRACTIDQFEDVRVAGAHTERNINSPPQNDFTSGSQISVSNEQVKVLIASISNR